MKFERVFLFLFFITGSLFAVGQQQKVMSAYDLYRLQQVSEAVISPDGSQVAYTVNVERPFEEGNGSDYRELYVMNVKSGAIKELITGRNRVTSINWTPDGKSVSFLARMSGDSRVQVYTIPAAGGETKKITSSSRNVAQYDWGQNDMLAYVSVTAPRVREAELKNIGFNAEIFEEDTTHRTLYIHNLTTNITSPLTKDVSVFELAFSPKGDKILAQIAPRNLVDDSYMLKRLYLIEVATGKTTKLMENPGKLSNMAWSPDGNHVAFVSAADLNDPVSGSLFIIPASGPELKFENIRNYTKGFEGSVDAVAWKDNKTVLYSSVESVDATLREFTIDGKESKIVIPGGKVVFDNFSVSNGIVAFAGNTAQHPDALYTYNLKKNDLEKRTDLNPWLKEIKMGKQEKISYEARDGLRIDGTLIYPVDYQPGQKYPLINYIHGGPESAVLNGWATKYSMWGQIAAGKGYFVFMPNYRASSGRGVEFAKMDQRDLGGAEFDDVLDGVKYLVEKGMVDRSKVGIGGGSYGGYFSAWAATKHSEHFQAAVAFVGISNQISKRNNTDIPMEDYHVHWRMHTNEDPMLVYDRSPVKWASNNQTPTLILHGKDDPRVHPAQSLELYRAIKNEGKAPVRLVWYPGEGHGNANNAAQLDYALRTMNWFDYYLKSNKPKDQLPPNDLGVDVEKLKEIDEEIRQAMDM